MAGVEPADGQAGPASGTEQQVPTNKKAQKAKEKRQRQKLNKQLRRQEIAEKQQQRAAQGQQAGGSGQGEDDEQIVIEYVSAPLELEGLSLGGSQQANGDGQAAGDSMEGVETSTAEPKDDPFAEFKRVFERFASAERVTGLIKDEEEESGGAQAEAGDGYKAGTKPDAAEDSDEDDEGGGAGGAGSKMTKKQRKALQQLKIAQLKQLCDRPDVVEVWDVTSQDPQLLVHLKAYRNTVSVPRHWSQKRKYLQGKRGLEKPPFKLPDFIEATGIGDMRQAYQEKEEAKKMKAKLRERMTPKMGRLDIDYQVLHDAFFKHQTKPKLTALGDIYYEGKEFEANLGHLKPGYLSPELRAALGMTDGAPPPWLINMQRYGPPPSYPNLRIPGLNAPIPPGAQFGYQPGGWGKPPVDEYGNPVYGDVFGAYTDEVITDDEVDKASRWGEPDPEVSESEEEEDEEEDEGEEDEDALAAGIASGMMSGLASGIASSLPSGIETPDVSVQLRKGNDSVEPAPQLYTVLEQKQVNVGQGALFGSDHVYVIPPGGAAAAGAAAAGGKKGGKAAPPGSGGEVEITLSPEEIEGLDEAGIKALYEEKMAEARGRREDFSDMVAARAAQQKRKIAQKSDAAKKQKTGSDFKF